MYVFLDGDNIQLDTFIKHLKPNIDEKYGKVYKLIVVCQSNMIFKHRSELDIEFRLSCTKTKNKNATDGKILFEIGKLFHEDEKIIIVSDDKIFEEVVDNSKIFLEKFRDIGTKRKVKRGAVLDVFTTLYENRSDPSVDIYLEDLFEHFNINSITEFKKFIETRIHEMNISCNNVVYLKN